MESLGRWLGLSCFYSYRLVIFHQVHFEVRSMLVEKTFFVALALFLSQLSFQPFAWSQTTRLNVGYSAASADQLPAWVAKETGLFVKNGLDVQLIFFTGGTTAIFSPLSCGGPITPVSGPPPVNKALAGSEAGFFAAGITALK